MPNSPERAAPAGWYPTAEGSTELRWWDGTGWTDQVNQTTPEAVAAVTDPRAPRAPEGTNTTTAWGWLLALIPLVSIALLIPLAGFVSTFRTVNPSNVVAVSALATSPALLGSIALSATANIQFVLFAFLDWRALGFNGVPKPFHWAWAFLAWASSIAVFVYVIGRTVIIRRRTGAGGFGPLVVFIVLEVILFVAGLVLAVILISSGLERFARGARIG
jgi:hypothetical protein